MLYDQSYVKYVSSVGHAHLEVGSSVAILLQLLRGLPTNLL